MTKSGGTATLGGNVTMGALTVNGSGGTLDLGTSLSHQVNGTVTLTAGTLLGDSSGLSVTGNWLNNGATFTKGSGTVTFNGTGAQSLGGSSTTTFNGLTINKTAWHGDSRNRSNGYHIYPHGWHF